MLICFDDGLLRGFVEATHIHSVMATTEIGISFLTCFIGSALTKSEEFRGISGQGRQVSRQGVKGQRRIEEIANCSLVQKNSGNSIS